MLVYIYINCITPVHTTKTFEDYLTIIDEKDIAFTEGRSGMVRDLGGGAKMEILHPSSPSSSHLNDASIVVKVTFGNVSFMLTGDAEQTSEGQILRGGYNLNSTILKVGHHGSKTSTTAAFLKQVDPDIAVIMVGSTNRYGHPHHETLANLSSAGIKIYRTDINGNIVITSDGQTYDINVKQPYQYRPPKEDTQKPTLEAKPDPEPAPPATTEGNYVGSVKSDKYHSLNCRYANNIIPENEILFKDVQEAKNAGYTPCGSCKPPG